MSTDSLPEKQLALHTFCRDLSAHSSSVSAASNLPCLRYKAPRFLRVVVTVGLSTLAALCQPPYSPYGALSFPRFPSSSRDGSVPGPNSRSWARVRTWKWVNRKLKKKKQKCWTIFGTKQLPACKVFQQLYTFLALNKQRPVNEKTKNFVNVSVCSLITKKYLHNIFIEVPSLTKLFFVFATFGSSGPSLVV